LFAPYRHAPSHILVTTEGGSGSPRIPATAHWVFLRRDKNWLLFLCRLFQYVTRQ
jgi:hypothetical protein